MDCKQTSIVIAYGDCLPSLAMMDLVNMYRLEWLLVPCGWTNILVHSILEVNYLKPFARTRIYGALVIS